MSNFTTDPSPSVKAQVEAQVELLLREAEIPATIITSTSMNNHTITYVSLDIPHSVGTLPEVAYLVDAAFCEDVELYSISLLTCECYAVTLRVHVRDLLAVDKEEQAA